MLNLLARLRGTGTVALAPAPAEAPAEAPAVLDFRRRMGRCELTGLPNRPALEFALTQQIESARTLETQLSLMVVCLDGFTAPRYGRPSEADLARLEEFARLMRGGLQRPYDVAASLSAGRFAVLLPFTDQVGATTVARAIQQAVGFPPAPAPSAPSAVRKAADGGDAPEDAGEDDTLAAEMAEDGLAEGDAAPAGAEVAPAPLFTVSIGLTGYKGVGTADAAALLRIAEEACDMARLDGGNRVVRRETTWSATVPAVQLASVE